MIIIAVMISECEKGKLDIEMQGDSFPSATNLEADAAGEITLAMVPVMEKFQPGTKAKIYQKRKSE